MLGVTLPVYYPQQHSIGRLNLTVGNSSFEEIYQEAYKLVLNSAEGCHGTSGHSLRWSLLS
jgi:hypothetical protein